MRNKQGPYLVFLLSIIIFFSFLNLVLFGVMASTIQDNQLMVTETQITNNTSDQYYPNIYNDTIIWFDFRSEIWDIYTYNLSTKKETPIRINGTHPSYPVIYENNIVWSDLVSSNRDSNKYLLPVIYLYNLSTSRQTQISSSEAATNPVIYGDRIVWMAGNNNEKENNSRDSATNWNIYVYDLSTSREIQLLSNNSIKLFPAIYKDKIVWMDSRNGGKGSNWDWNFTGNWDIYMYNLSTSKETRITTDESLQMRPSIYGNNIVWLDDRNGNWKIYGYNLTTSMEIPISNVSWQYDHPSIYDDKIVWMDTRGSDWEVYMYDLSTSKENQITNNSSNSQNPSNPAIYENKIIWQNEDNGNRDIYMYTISEKDAESDNEQQSEERGNRGIPGFGIVSGIVCFIGTFLYRMR